MVTSTHMRHARNILADMLNGFLAGLLGAGGVLRAVHRTSSPAEAAEVNRAMGVMIVLAAWMVRATVIPPHLLALHRDAFCTLVVGSLGGAWCATDKARNKTWLALDRAMLVIVPAFAVVMLAQAMMTGREMTSLFASTGARAAGGVLAGFCIGFVSTAFDTAGSLLLVPAIVVLFGTDSKIAGSLALSIALPCMLAGWRRSSGAVLLAFLRQQPPVCLMRLCPPVAGIAAGVQLLHFISSRLLLTVALLLAFYMACMQGGAWVKKNVDHVP